MQDSYSLSEVCGLIGEIIETTMPDTLRVRAEIANISIKAGHCYMELIEKAKSSALLAAKVRAVCWNQTWSMLSAYFMHETGQTLSVGMQVLLDVRVDFHSVFGLSLQVNGIDPAYTLGELSIQRRHTIEKLQTEGMTEMQQMLNMPLIPLRLAIVSSPDAAGYDDFVHQLRSCRFRFTTSLFPALMQGDKAAMSVISALSEIYDKIDDFDAVVIIRGGGATTDLTCFDNYELALHIAQFPLPVVTGIGHQRDMSVADMVAYKSVKTPTAAAEWFIQLIQAQQERLLILKNRMYSTVDMRISVQRNKLQIIKINLMKVIDNYVNLQRNRLLIAEKTIKLVSPEDIYKKGYSLTKINGKILKSVVCVNKGDVISTELADGVIKSEIL